MSFKPNDKVICVDANPNSLVPQFNGWKELKKGATYTVRRANSCNMYIEGIRVGFLPERFRLALTPTRSFGKIPHVV